MEKRHIYVYINHLRIILVHSPVFYANDAKQIIVNGSLKNIQWRHYFLEQ